VNKKCNCCILLDLFHHYMDEMNFQYQGEGRREGKMNESRIDRCGWENCIGGSCEGDKGTYGMKFI